MYKPTKSEVIKIRITPEDKRTIVDYCENHSIQMSEFIRNSILNLIKESQ